MKRTVIFALLFALVFGIFASWLGPKMIAYWYAPPVKSGMANAFNCTDAVEWAMNRLVWTQVIGSAAGALLGLLVGALVGRGRGDRRPAPATTPPSRPGT